MKQGFTANALPYQYSNAKRFSILLLDDEPDVTTILKKGLAQQPNFTVAAYNDPEEALASVSTSNYDIMIVDIRLPKMDGFEFYQKASQIKEGIRVVFITASDNYHEEYQQRFPQWNGNCFILKPVSLFALTRFLLAELMGTRAEREPFN